MEDGKDGEQAEALQCEETRVLEEAPGNLSSSFPYPGSSSGGGIQACQVMKEEDKFQAESRGILREYGEPVHHEESSIRQGHKRCCASPSLEVFNTELLQSHEEPGLTSHLASL